MNRCYNNENRRNKNYNRSFVFWLWLLLCTTAAIFSSASSSHNRPNIVLVLTDDLDLTLGGTGSLQKTRRLIGNQGLTLSNWFVHTPVCCPSRAELLTGRMFHNLKVRNASSANEGCMAVDVSGDPNCSFYSRYYFAKHFSRIGYTVGVFGKHLNNYNPDSPPAGVDRWLVNGGGDYNDPAFSWSASAGTKSSAVRFDNCTGADGEKRPCYSTSVIGNSSIDWIRDHLRQRSSDEDSTTREKKKKPFFALISVKAPHIQDGPGYPVAVPAPWHTKAPVEARSAPRTPNYNASCPDHHWLVRQQEPLTDLEGTKIDELYVSRLRALLSVDDLVEELVETLREHRVLNETYIVFTSDNGYRFGQFRMPQGKWHPYENDIRVPFMIRGPGIKRPGSVRSDILGTHVDLMPTLLGLAAENRLNNNAGGSIVPSTMDGDDLSREILLDDRDDHGTFSSLLQHRRRKPSSSSVVLIEYIGLGDVVRYGHLEDSYNNTFRALRLIDGDQPEGQRNIKYVEFTDCTEDWDFAKEPLEHELFDLDSDPFEMTNLLSPSRRENVPEDFLDYLRATTRRLFACSGRGCSRRRRGRKKSDVE